MKNKSTSSIGLIAQKAFSVAMAWYIFMSTAFPLALLNPVKAADETEPAEAIETTVTPTATPEVTVEETPVVTPAATEETKPTVETTPEVTEEVVPTVEVTPTTEVTPGSTPSPEITEPVKEVPVWQSTVENTFVTSKAVELNRVYTIESIPGFSIEFTKLPAETSVITVTKSVAPAKVNNTVSYGYSYEVTSEMVNGTFEYTMTLPKPANKESEVVFSEDGKKFSEIKNESETKTTISFTANHFTEFIVTVPADNALCVGMSPNCYTDIQAAINAASNGDVITIWAGTYNPTTTINVNKEITIQGAGAATTIIDASGMPATSYGMYVTASNVTISGITLQNAPGYGMKIAGISPVRISNVSVSNVIVKDSARSNIDFNGVNNISVSNVTATGTPYGVGIAVTDGIGGTFSNITTSGNAWAGMAFYTSTYFPPAGVSDMAISGSNSFGEAVPFYTEGTSFSNITVSPTDSMFSYSPVPGVTVYVLRISAPTHVGWNVGSESTTPNEMPIDRSCSATLAVNQNNVAMNWTPVVGASVKYQREVTYPNGTVGYFYNTPAYTPFSTFGSATGIEGLWNTRVRAYTDVNGNNMIDASENTSVWSNACAIRFDITNPAKPTITAPVGDYANVSPILNAWTAITDDSGIKEYQVEYIYADGHTFSGAPYRTSTTNSRNHTPTLAEQGGVQIRVRALDNAGNYGEWSEPKSYIYDATKPVTTVSGIDAAWHATDVTVNFSCTDLGGSDCDKTYYIIDGGAAVEGTSVTLTTEGQHTVAYYSVDKAGNVETTNTSAQTVNIDKTAPAVPTGLHFDNTARTTSFACSAVTTRQPAIPDWDSITGDSTFSHYEYTSFHPSGAIGLNEQVMATSEFVNNWMPPTDGAYGYAVRSVDFAGNKSAWAISGETLADSCQIIYDSVAPIATVMVNRSLLYDAQRRIVVTLNYNEPMNTAVNPTVSFSGATGTWSVFTAGAWLNATQYQIEYRVTDAGEETPTVTVSSANAKDIAGNTEAASVTTTFAIDTKNPIVSWLLPANNEHIRGNVTLSASAFDAMSGINYVRFRYKVTGAADSTYVTINQTGLVPYTYSWNTTALTDGAYTLRLRGQDGATNFTLQHINVVIDNTAPVVDPIADIEEEATSAAGAIVTFSTSATDAIDGVLPVVCTPLASGAVFPIGTTAVTCTATDLAGNTASVNFNVLVRDTTAPTVPTNLRFANPALSCGSYTNVGFNTVDWDDSSDAVGVTYYDYAINYPLIPSGSGQGDWATTRTVSNYSGSLNPGVHYVKVQARDAAGNASGWTPLCSITYDPVAPDVQITSPTATLLNGIVPIRGTVTDDYPWRYYLVIQKVGGSVVAGPGTVYESNSFTDRFFFDWDTTAVADGDYIIKLEARDRALNKDAGSSHWMTVTVDNTAPVIVVTAEDESIITDGITVEADSPLGKIVNFNAVATDAHDGDVAVTCIPVSGSQFPIYPVGTTTVTCTASDAVGNVATSTFTVTVEDTTNPTISDVPDATLYEGDAMPAFSVTVTDIVGVRKVCMSVTGPGMMVPTISESFCDYSHNLPAETTSTTLDVNALLGLAATVDLSLYPEGTYVFTYWAEDEAGNPSNEQETTIVVVNVPPTLTLTTAQNADRTFTYTAVGAGGNSPLSYTWTNGDFAGCSGTNQTVITPNLPRDYTCTVTVTDADGDSVSRTATVTVEALPPAEPEVLGENTEEEEVTPSVTPTPAVLGERVCSEKRALVVTVYLDKNGNGTRDNDEKAVESVKGEVYYTVENEKLTVGNFTSDNEGKWKLDVCAGDYTIKVDTTSLPANAKVAAETLGVSVLENQAETNIAITIKEEADKKSIPYWIYILILLIAIGAIGYVVYKNRKE
jgi:hypothetical protein